MENEQLVCQKCQKIYKSDSDFLKETDRWSLSEDQTLWFYCRCGAVLHLPKGSYPWYSPTVNMSKEAATAFDLLHIADKLPHIKNHIFSIQQLLADDESAIEDLVAEIKKDPILAADLLKIASNLQIAQSKQPSIRHATVFLGRRTVSTLVLGAAIKAVKLDTKSFTQESFWREALTTGYIAEKICQNFVGEVNFEEAFVTGCLINLGKIVAAMYMPSTADEIEMLVTDPKTQSTWLKAEKQVTVFDHCVLGEIGATLWGLPEHIRTCIRYHHLPEILPRSHRDKRLLEVTALANQLCHWVLLNPHRIDKKILKDCSESIGLNDSRLEEFVKSLSPVSMDK